MGVYYHYYLFVVLALVCIGIGSAILHQTDDTPNSGRGTGLVLLFQGFLTLWFLWAAIPDRESNLLPAFVLIWFMIFLSIALVFGQQQAFQITSALRGAAIAISVITFLLCFGYWVSIMLMFKQEDRFYFTPERKPHDFTLFEAQAYAGDLDKDRAYQEGEPERKRQYRRNALQYMRERHEIAELERQLRELQELQPVS